MQTATIRVTMGPGIQAQIERATPPQAHLYQKIHGKGAGGTAVEILALTADREVNPVEERIRLGRVFKGKVVAETYPGHSPQLPQTFHEAGFIVPQPAPAPTPAPVEKDSPAPTGKPPEAPAVRKPAAEKRA